MKPFGIIYLAEQTKNGKLYIGQTVQSLQQRIYNHSADAKRKNIHFNNAIKKYGVNGFQWTIIHECYSRKELDDMEIYYIKLYNTTKNEIGYNLTTGGGGRSGYKSPSSSLRMKLNNPMFNKDTAKRIGEHNRKIRTGKTFDILYGKEHSDKIKKSMSLRMKLNNPMFNKDTVNKMSNTKKERVYTPWFLSEEAKQKIGEKNSKNWLITTPTGEEIYINNLLQFCRDNNLSSGHMCRVSQGTRKTHKGYKCVKCP